MAGEGLIVAGFARKHAENGESSMRITKQQFQQFDVQEIIHTFVPLFSGQRIVNSIALRQWMPCACYDWMRLQFVPVKEYTDRRIETVDAEVFLNTFCSPETSAIV